MIKKEHFFREYKVSGVTEEAYAKASLYITRFMDAFANTTGNCLYIIDYHKKNFPYVSSNALFLCGLSPDEMKQIGFDFYIQHVPETEHAMLLKANRAGFRFSDHIAPEERFRYTISYDFHILPPGDSPLLINHQITPMLLTPSGDIWLALCVARLSSGSVSGQIEVTSSTSGNRWRFEDGRWKPCSSICLTENERTMLRMAAEGLTMDKMAERLHRSADTIKSYRRSSFIKLGVNNITEAVVAAINKKLI